MRFSPDVKSPAGSGFTLIELSIVLVIIGLIIGGIVVGQTLIHQARLRQGLSQIQQYQVAATTFRVKYGCLPGDCPNATNFFGSATQPGQVTNGNGDGMIQASDSGNLNGWNLQEMYSVFDHLAAAGLVSFPQYDETAALPTINETGVSFPESKFEAVGTAQSFGVGPRSNSRPGIQIGYQVGVGYIPAGNVMRIGVCKFSNWGGFYLGGECALNPWEAFFVDSKIDDGMPTTGAVMVVPQGFYMLPNNGFSLGPPQCSTSTLDYVTGAVIAQGVYRNEQTLPNSSYQRTCLLEIKMHF